MSISINLWEQVGNKCLQQALTLLESETSPTERTVKLVRELTETAIAIDSLNLSWQAQSRYGAKGSSKHPFDGWQLAEGGDIYDRYENRPDF